MEKVFLVLMIISLFGLFLSGIQLFNIYNNFIDDLKKISMEKGLDLVSKLNKKNTISNMVFASVVLSADILKELNFGERKSKFVLQLGILVISTIFVIIGAIGFIINIII